MSRFPTRNEYTFWYNDEPIRDINEALHLLNTQGSSSEPYHLTKYSDPQLWEIVAPWYHEGSSGADSGGNDYFQIDKTLAEQLLRELLVEPRRINYFGGFRLDPDQLVISKTGEQQVHAFNQKMRTKAQSLLILGTHTNLTGEVVYRGHDRENRTHGKLYFEFLGPYDETCRVYPEENRVVFPYPPPKMD